MIDVLKVAYSLAAWSVLLLLGRFLVRLACFGRHADNPVYRGFCVLTSPLVGIARALVPRRVPESMLPLIALALLLGLCLGFALTLPRLAAAGA